MEMGKETQHFLEQPAAPANESCKLISDFVIFQLSLTETNKRSYRLVLLISDKTRF